MFFFNCVLHRQKLVVFNIAENYQEYYLSKQHYRNTTSKQLWLLSMRQFTSGVGFLQIIALTGFYSTLEWRNPAFIGASSDVVRQLFIWRRYLYGSFATRSHFFLVTVSWQQDRSRIIHTKPSFKFTHEFFSESYRQNTDSNQFSDRVELKLSERTTAGAI